MKKLLLLAFLVSTLFSGCVVYSEPRPYYYQSTTYYAPTRHYEPVRNYYPEKRYYSAPNYYDRKYYPSNYSRSYDNHRHDYYRSYDSRHYYRR